MGVSKSDRGWFCRGNTPWLKRTNYSITGIAEQDSEENKHRIRHMDRGNSGVGVGEHSTKDFYDNAEDALAMLADAKDRLEALEDFTRDE